MTFSRRSGCGNISIYFQFTFLLRVTLLLLLLVPVVVVVVVVVVLLVVGAVELGRPMAVTGATDEIGVTVAITVAGR